MIYLVGKITKGGSDVDYRTNKTSFELMIQGDIMKKEEEEYKETIVFNLVLLMSPLYSHLGQIGLEFLEQVVAMIMMLLLMPMLVSVLLFHSMYPSLPFPDLYLYLHHRHHHHHHHHLLLPHLGRRVLPDVYLTIISIMTLKGKIL